MTSKGPEGDVLIGSNALHKTVVIRQVGDKQEETGFMCGRCVPDPDTWERGSKEQRKRVQFWTYGDGYFYVKMPHGHAQKWDGQAANFSTYA